jgi:hypothetical protein
MNKSCRSFAFLLLAMVALPVTTWAQQRVLIVPREGSIALDYMIEHEVLVIRDVLNDAGYAVDIATRSGNPMRGTTMNLDPVLKVSEVNLSLFTGVILACMAAGSVGSWDASADEINLVTQAVRKGLLVGAQASALITLAEAGLLDGKDYCYYKDVSYYPGFKKGNWKGLGVIQDGLLITSSSCPYVPVEYGQKMKDYTAEFAAAFAKALGK